MQTCLVLAVGVWLLVLHAKGLYSTDMNVPFLKDVRPNLLIDAWLGSPATYPLAFIGFFLFLWLVVVGASNAVNMTDGLDGLAAGLMIIAGGAMTVLCYVSGHARFATYLDILRLSGAAELTVFCPSPKGSLARGRWAAAWESSPS